METSPCPSALFGKTKLGRILYRDDPLFLRDNRRERIEQGCLAAARSPGNRNVASSADSPFQKRLDQGIERPQIPHLPQGKRMGAEFPDGYRRAIQRQRRNHRVDPVPFRQTGIYHGGRFVNSPSQRPHDPVDQRIHLGVFSEWVLGLIEVPLPLVIQRLGAIHHDLRDRLVFEHFL